MSKNRIIAVVVLGLLVVGAQIPTARADFTFGPRVDLGPPVNSPDYTDGNPIISRNGLELYFYSNRPGGYGSGDVWVCKRASVEDPWGPAENLGPGINGANHDCAESISSDGLTLYISVTTGSDSAMYTSTRPTIDAPWGPRVKMSPVLGQAAFAVVSPDDLELYFMGGSGMGRYDIWVSTRATRNDPWGPPVNLGPTINTSSNDCPASISPDGLILFIITDRPGGFGGYDTWMARRPSKGAAWSAPVNLGPSFNTLKKHELSCVSADGRWAYIFDNTAGGSDDVWMAPILPIVDFNGDGQADGKDLLCMTYRWGTNNPLCDIGPFAWGDGTVDLQDVIVLAEYLGKEVIDPTLIAHWTLDETEGTAAVDSAGGKDGSVLGDAIWQPDGGQVGGALQLDGVDDCVIAPFILNPADGSFSVIAWVQGGAPGQVILSQAGAANWLMADSANGALRTNLKEPGTTGRDPKASGPPLISSTVVSDGNWHRVGFVRDGINRILYMDDAEVARDTAINLEAADGDLHIGVGSGLEPGSFWSGLIDDVRIYNRAVHP